MSPYSTLAQFLAHHRKALQTAASDKTCKTLEENSNPDILICLYYFLRYWEQHPSTSWPPVCHPWIWAAWPRSFATHQVPSCGETSVSISRGLPAPWLMGAKHPLPPGSLRSKAEVGLCQTRSCDRAAPEKQPHIIISQVVEPPCDAQPSRVLWGSSNAPGQWQVLVLTAIPAAQHHRDVPATFSKPHESKAPILTSSIGAAFMLRIYSNSIYISVEISLISMETILINANVYRHRSKSSLQSPRASKTKRHLGRIHEQPDCVHFQGGIHMYSTAIQLSLYGIRLCLMSNQPAAGTNTWWLLSAANATAFSGAIERPKLQIRIWPCWKLAGNRKGLQLALGRIHTNSQAQDRTLEPAVTFRGDLVVCL